MLVGYSAVLAVVRTLPGVSDSGMARKDAGQTCDPSSRRGPMLSLCSSAGGPLCPHSCSSPARCPRFLLPVKKVFWDSLNFTERNVILSSNCVRVLPLASPLLSLFVDGRSQQLVTGCAAGQVRAPRFPGVPWPSGHLHGGLSFAVTSRSLWREGTGGRGGGDPPPEAPRPGVSPLPGPPGGGARSLCVPKAPARSITVSVGGIRFEHFEDT